MFIELTAKKRRKKSHTAEVRAGGRNIDIKTWGMRGLMDEISRPHPRYIRTKIKKKKSKVPLVPLSISRANSSQNIYTSEALGHIIFSEKARLAYACYAIQKEQKVLRKEIDKKITIFGARCKEHIKRQGKMKATYYYK